MKLLGRAVQQGGRIGIIIGHAFVTQIVDVRWSDGRVDHGIKIRDLTIEGPDNDEGSSFDR